MKTPIVFIIFNRPELTQRVFEEIRRARPEILFIIADGPRPHKIQDAELCKQTRAIVEKIDWPCEVHRNYSEINLGCGKRVSSGLDWVFSQCEQAIILEDDCLPSANFFKFCEAMLDLYKNDSQIMSVSGFSPPIKDLRNLSEDYYFSKLFWMWGWATWKRAWQHYDFKMTEWPKYKESQKLYEHLSEFRMSNQFERDFDNVYYNNGEIGVVDTWDFQFVFSHFFHESIVIKPKYNLIENIGIGHHDATHTVLSNKLGNIKRSLTENRILDNSLSISYNPNIDKKVFGVYHQKSKLLFQIKKIIKKNKMLSSALKKIYFKIHKLLNSKKS